MASVEPSAIINLFLFLPFMHSGVNSQRTREGVSAVRRRAHAHYVRTLPLVANCSRGKVEERCLCAQKPSGRNNGGENKGGNSDPAEMKKKKCGGASGERFTRGRGQTVIW